MPPKKKADQQEEAPAAKKTAAAASAIAANASKITTSAKAIAAGKADMIERTPTPRKPRAESGLVLVHWNVGGLNGLLNGKNADERKALLSALVEAETPDVLAISEHKLQQKNVAAAEAALLGLLPGYTAHWAVCTAKNGYSGVVCLVRSGVEVSSVSLDAVESINEGRTVSIEFPDCHAVAAYVPNAGQDLKRLDYRIDTWEPAMRSYLQTLQASGKPVVLFGDLNVAHLDADIWNVTAKHVPKSAGCTPRERAAFGALLASGPFVDCFRQLWPDASGAFSYWSTRSGNQLLNRGLRLDYAVASASLAAPGAALSLHDCAYLAEYAPNGDHAPSLVALARTAAA